MNQKIGIIDQGTMGKGMASSLRRAGYQVHICDVRPEAVQVFAVEGGVACANPAEVAAQCEVVVSVVVNAVQTEAVLFGEGAQLLDWSLDARITSIVGGWPSRFNAQRAHDLGLRADSSVDALLQDYLETVRPIK